MQNKETTESTVTLGALIESTSAMAENRWAGKEYLLLNLAPESMGNDLPSPFKIDCLSVFFCTGGQAEMNVNFSNVRMTENSLLVLSPDNLIELKNTSHFQMRCYAMFLSRDFMNMLSIDNNAYDFRNVKPESTALINLDHRRSELMRKYFELLQLTSECNAGIDDVYSISIMRSFVTALIYQLMQVANSQGAPRESAGGKMAKKSYYVRDFMKLVAENFREQRSINFYADRLYISSKYLSLIIKEATGYTATDWIDHYVTMEAKNLLRFSGRNIQQIAYDLNFHNQSSFGKYFKHQTGMSPSQFRKS